MVRRQFQPNDILGYHRMQAATEDIEISSNDTYSTADALMARLNYIYKGSALKFFDLAEGRAEVYPRFAPTMEWDIAAGQAILEALGGSVVTVKHNRPLRYNKEELFNPRFIAKTKALLKA